MVVISKQALSALKIAHPNYGTFWTVWAKLVGLFSRPLQFLL